MILTPLLQTTIQLDLAGEAANQDLAGSATAFPDVVTGILSAIMVIGALIVLMYFMWGAIEWITAGGDSGKIEKARNRITQSVIGMLVLSMTFAFFFALQEFLGIEIFEQGGSSSSSSSSSGPSSRSNSFTETLRNSGTRSFGLPTRKE